MLRKTSFNPTLTTSFEFYYLSTKAEKLLIYWGAKESLYKIYGLKEVDFIKNLHIKPFIKHNLGTIIGTIDMLNFNQSFELNYLKMDDYMLVYALMQIQ